MGEVLNLNQEQIFKIKVKKYMEHIIKLEKENPTFDFTATAIYSLTASYDILISVLRECQTEIDFKESKNALIKYIKKCTDAFEAQVFGGDDDK